MNTRLPTELVPIAPYTIILPPPCFTVVFKFLCFSASPSLRHTNRIWLRSSFFFWPSLFNFSFFTNDNFFTFRNSILHRGMWFIHDFTVFPITFGFFPIYKILNGSNRLVIIRNCMLMPNVPLDRKCRIHRVTDAINHSMFPAKVRFSMTQIELQRNTSFHNRHHGGAVPIIEN